ncbi:hypothetical protein CONLIGDRAFT_207172 [Coniochaeta ligniaria NRRL 30616]|uniref:Uncharacterized protein n=1 Tax=Coniochaeta ligniaria NRRL 30616 TaxID=1408157 RepID=A0A1J7J2Q0_9PEZI|nr:hypothetical protein CONLIGDRAFT_207172 [Coniochaeta ligniaria NRRL 30616]
MEARVSANVLSIGYSLQVLQTCLHWRICARSTCEIVWTYIPYLRLSIMSSTHHTLGDPTWTLDAIGYLPRHMSMDAYTLLPGELGPAHQPLVLACVGERGERIPLGLCRCSRVDVHRSPCIRHRLALTPASFGHARHAEPNAMLAIPLIPSPWIPPLACPSQSHASGTERRDPWGGRCGSCVC